GVGDYLTVLTAQRSLWSAQQELLALQLTDFTNRIALAVAGRRYVITQVRNNMARVSLSWALILGLLAGIGPMCTDLYLPALPEMSEQLAATTTI
ncbi:hypothetical protein AAIH02_33990, partial [Pseudomonas aeruginosa]